MADDKEIWKAHPTYPREVSTRGRVRNKETGKLCKLTPSGGGGVGRTGYRSTPRYLRVRASTEVVVQVHVLILETFIGPRPEDHEPDHIDFNGFNNRLDNLRWITKEENQARRRTRRNFQPAR